MLIYYIDSSEISLSYKLTLIIHGPDRSFIKRNFFPLRCNSLAQHFQNTVHGLLEGEALEGAGKDYPDVGKQNATGWEEGNKSTMKKKNL